MAITIVKGEFGNVREEIILSCKEAVSGPGIAGGEVAPIMECKYISRLKDLDTGETIEQELATFGISLTGGIVIDSDYIASVDKRAGQIVIGLDNRWVKWGEKYGVYWKGKLVEGGFDTEAEAQTFINIKSTEMELGDYTPSELERFLKIKKIPAGGVT